MKTLLTISFFLLTIISFGQEKADREVTRLLISTQIDTFIIIKSGCSSCPISYNETEKINKIDTIAIDLLFQKNGKVCFMTFSDTSQTKNISNVDTDIFKYIADSRQLLWSKDTYYQEQKLAKFQAPCLVTFPYETIQLKYGQFKFEHTLVNRESDNCGTILTNEDWFKAEIEILKIIDKLKRGKSK